MRLMSRVVVSAGGTWLVLLHAAAICGQTPSRTILRTPVQGQLTDGTPLYSTPASSSEDVLLEMAGRAAVIFVGRVMAVQKPSDDLLRTGSAGAVVEVDFTVERSVRGAVAGSMYAVREWAGMWRDNPRFLPGQRLLMLLHAPGPGGLSSPVDGLDGAIPIRSGGASTAVALTGKDLKAQASSQVDETTSYDQVDMRWLQAKTLRIPSYSDAPTADPGVGGVGGAPVTIVAEPSGTVSTGSGASAGSGAVSQSSTDTTGSTELLSRVLGLLGSVQALNEGTQSASH